MRQPFTSFCFAPLLPLFRWTTTVLAVLCATMACAPVEARFDLVFPSPESFFLAEDIEVTVYDIDDEDAGDLLCTRLAIGLPSDAKVVARTDKVGACEFQGGQGVLEALPPRNLVFVATVFDLLGTEILRGCRRVAVSEERIDVEGMLVEIPLAVNSTYPGSEVLHEMCREVETAATRKCQDGLSCDTRTED